MAADRFFFFSLLYFNASVRLINLCFQSLEPNKRPQHQAGGTQVRDGRVKRYPSNVHVLLAGSLQGRKALASHADMLDAGGGG